MDGGTGITGSAGAWRNIDTAVLGPAIAEEPATALTLLTDLVASVDGPFRLDVDHRHPELAEWAARIGLDRGFTTAVMVPPDCGGDPARLFTPVMQALG